jgi:hypothetical protein
VPTVRLFAISLTTAALMAAPASASLHARPNAVTAWNAYAGNAALAACIAPVDNPLNESRMYAMTHVAIHDALNAIDRRSDPYVYDARAQRGASPDAAVAAAARGVLVRVLGELQPPFPQACIDAGVATVESAYGAALGAIPDGSPKDRGVAVGQAAAAAVLALRATDGADTTLLDFVFPQHRVARCPFSSESSVSSNGPNSLATGPSESARIVEEEHFSLARSGSCGPAPLTASLDALPAKRCHAPARGSAA